MGIKNLKPTHNSKYKQGYYQPKNPDKYMGDLNKIIYRSGLEKKFMTWCDLSKNVLKWSSEPFHINYINEADNKKHKYYIDFYIEVLQNDGTIKKFIIEVKPEAKLHKPKIPKKKTKKALKNYEYLMKEYVTNYSKFKHATKYAESTGCHFKIMTESTISKLR